MSKFFGNSGSGSGVISPTLQSGVTLAGSEVTDTFRITNNDATNPIAVKLSDSLGYIEWLNPDDGTDVYAIEGGAFRDIEFQRTGSVPTSGGPFTTTVTVLLPNGDTTTEDIDIEVANTVPGLLQGLSSVTYLHDFTSTTPVIDNYSWGNLTLNGSATVNNSPPAGSGFLATMSINSQTKSASFQAPSSQIAGISGQTRSWIIALQVSSSNISGSERPIYGSTDDNYDLAGARCRGALSEALRFTPGAIAGGTLITVSSGVATDMSPATPYLLLIVANWNGVGTLQVHTRGTGDGAWATQSVANGADVSTATLRTHTLSGNGTAALLSEWGSFCVRDVETTTAELADIVTAMGGL